MKVLVVGSGGREHAIIKKLKENKKEQVALPYKNEDTEINLPCIDETDFKDNENKVAIKSKEFRQK